MNKYDKQHQRNIAAYENEIEKLYKQLITQFSLLGASLSLSDDSLFSFDDYPQLKRRVEALFQSLSAGMSSVIVNGIRSEWTLANNKNSELARQIFGDNVGSLTQEQYRRYFSNNADALEAFLNRKRNGLGLSDYVWKYTNQFKNEIELGLEVGIRNGMSADQMARELRQYLKYPDMLFRRVRDERGDLQLSKRAAAFHPGQGVYRNSCKNARRLAATETNIAYMTADYERWQQLDFVVGIEIRLSNNHTLNGKKFTDICDELKGKYPKDFKFTGWHPLCRCHAISILKTEEERDEDSRKFLNGEPIDGESVNRVEDVPENFKKWMRDNEGRYNDAAKRGTLPYFIRDNQEIVEDVLLHSLNDVSLKFNDPNNITNQEIVDALKAFAAANPHMFNGGLIGVEIEKTRRYFMANQRGYDSQLRYNGTGNTLYISSKDFTMRNGEVYNPLEEVRKALRAISLGEKMTFKQEYSLEGLWHEIKHAQSAGWGSRYNRTDLNGAAMEVVNQFCARHSYADFVKSLGGKAVNVSSVISKGYGYRYEVANFQSLLYALNVKQTTAYRYFRSIIQKNPYEDIFDEVVKFVETKGGLDHSEAYDIVEKMIQSQRADFNAYLKDLKKK